MRLSIWSVTRVICRVPSLCFFWQFDKIPAVISEETLDDLSALGLRHVGWKQWAAGGFWNWCWIWCAWWFSMHHPKLQTVNVRWCWIIGQCFVILHCFGSSHIPMSTEGLTCSTILWLCRISILKAKNKHVCGYVWLCDISIFKAPKPPRLECGAVHSSSPGYGIPIELFDPSWRFASTSCIPWSRSSPMIVILGQRRNVWAVYTYNITHIWRKLNLIELYIYIYIILCVHIYIYIYIYLCMYHHRRKLEVKLPTIWTDEKQSREEAERRERLEERRVEEKESEERRCRCVKKVGKSRNIVFFQWFVAPEIRKVLHAVVARSTFPSQNVQNTRGSDHFWKFRSRKVHAVVARPTFASQNVQNTPASEHFWKLRCRKSARRRGAKHISKSKCTKHTSFGALLEVEMSKKCGAKHISKWKCTKHHMFAPLLDVPMWKKWTPLWREAHFEVKMLETLGFRTTFGGSDVASLHYTTLHYTTLHYTALHYTTLHNTTTTTTTTTQLHSTTLHYTPLHSHYTTNNHTTLHYITLHSTTLHYITLHYTTFHYTSLHYTTLYPLHYNYNYTTTLHYNTLHYTKWHYTTLHYTRLHYTTLHYITLHYSTFHYTSLHYSTLHSTTLQLQLRMHNYTPLHSTRLNYTTPHYITLHYTTFHYTPLHYTTLHYTTLH